MTEKNYENLFTLAYNLLDNFKREFDELTQKLGKIDDKTGDLEYFFFPVGTINLLLSLIDYLDNQNCNVKSLRDQFEKIHVPYREFIKANGEQYLKHALNIFRFEVNAFHPEMEFADIYDFDYYLDMRTRIEDLTGELKPFFDISKECEIMRKKDRILKKRLWEEIKIHAYMPEDLEYAPEAYWWLHLNQVYGLSE